MNLTGTTTVHYDRKVSDGDYGNESASCSITADFDIEALDDGYVQELLARLSGHCRDAVQRQLARSAEPHVRLAAETREEREQRKRLELAVGKFDTSWHRARGAQAALDQATRDLDRVRRQQQLDPDSDAGRKSVAMYEGVVADTTRRRQDQHERLLAAAESLREAGGDPEAREAELEGDLAETPF